MAKDPYRVKSLQTLLDQVNKAAPKRSKVSDGWIGDKAHSKRKSQHNPDADGSVDAIDITHDPKGGCDCAIVTDAIRRSKDKRVGYVIFKGRIFSGPSGKQPFVWRPYTGSNKHTKHMHIDVLDKYQDATTPWAIGIEKPGKAKPIDAPKPLNENQKQSVLRKGSKGEFVSELQTGLLTLGYPLKKIDGIFGVDTERAVKAFQADRGLTVDGWAGPRTMDQLGQAMKEKQLKPEIAKAEKEIPTTAKNEVKQKSNWWTSITGGLAGVGTVITAVTGMDWKVVVAIGATGIVAIVVLLLLRRQIIAAFQEINDRAND